jgi:hypothetical protein
MRGTSLGIVVIALTLGAAFGDPPGKEAPASDAKSTAQKLGVDAKFEDLIAEAFKFNPEILVAEAKIRDAELELRRF